MVIGAPVVMLSTTRTSEECMLWWKYGQHDDLRAAKPWATSSIDCCCTRNAGASRSRNVLATYKALGWQLRGKLYVQSPRQDS